MRIYIDGSYDPHSNVYGYGIVAISDAGRIEKFFGANNSTNVSRLRNVSGELIAAMLAVNFAEARHSDNLKIFYDYEGIRAWAEGYWKRKNGYTAKYASFMREKMNKMSISFEKVDAHTGDKYNELADTLAKYGIRKFISEEGMVNTGTGNVRSREPMQWGKEPIPKIERVGE